MQPNIRYLIVFISIFFAAQLNSAAESSFLSSIHNFFTEPKNKIVILVSTPRACSTAFLRMMEARGDFKVMHEPTLRLFRQKMMPHANHDIWFNKSAFSTYKAFQTYIFEQARATNLFIKEMAFDITSNMKHFKELIKNPAVHIVFLMRNPAETIISMYLKHREVAKKDDVNVFDNLVNYQKFLDLMQLTEHTAINKPHYIRAEKLHADPASIVEAFCDAVDIPFIKKALVWNDLGDNFDAETAWHEIKRSDLTYLWHGDAIHSTGFIKPKQYHKDHNNNYTFQEMDNLADRTYCQSLYKKQLPYYKNCKEHFRRYIRYMCIETEAIHE